MKNIIEFKIKGDAKIYHNGLPVIDNIVECKHGQNILFIEGKNFHIEYLTMYELGQDKIKLLGKWQDNGWILEYEYPVFTWLHKVLNHGWLIKEDDEE